MCLYINNNREIVIDIGHPITKLSVYLYIFNMNLKRYFEALSKFT